MPAESIPPHRNQRRLRKFHCTECGEVKVETIPRTDSGASSSGAGDQTENQTGNQNGTRTAPQNPPLEIQHSPSHL